MGHVLFSGVSGTGKTTFAMDWIKKTLQEKEKATYIHLDYYEEMAAFTKAVNGKNHTLSREGTTLPTLSLPFPHILANTDYVLSALQLLIGRGLTKEEEALSISIIQTMLTQQPHTFSFSTYVQKMRSANAVGSKLVFNDFIFKQPAYPTLSDLSFSQETIHNLIVSTDSFPDYEYLKCMSPALFMDMLSILQKQEGVYYLLVEEIMFTHVPFMRTVFEDMVMNNAYPNIKLMLLTQSLQAHHAYSFVHSFDEIYLFHQMPNRSQQLFYLTDEESNIIRNLARGEFCRITKGEKNFFHTPTFEVH